MKYHLTSRIFHWLMAILIIAMIGFGIYITDFISDDSSKRDFAYEMHKSFGVLVIILVFLRLINRIIHRPPALPVTMKKYEQYLAHLGHLGLYFLMFLTPIAGYLMSNAYGFEVKLFGITLPSLISTNFDLAKEFKELHEISAFAMLGLVVIHVIAVIKHRYFDQKENDILNRML